MYSARLCNVRRRSAAVKLPLHAGLTIFVEMPIVDYMWGSDEDP
jgi:hypothetical protein